MSFTQKSWQALLTLHESDKPLSRRDINTHLEEPLSSNALPNMLKRKLIVLENKKANRQAVDTCFSITDEGRKEVEKYKRGEVHIRAVTSLKGKKMRPTPAPSPASFHDEVAEAAMKDISPLIAVNSTLNQALQKILSICWEIPSPTDDHKKDHPALTKHNLQLFSRIQKIASIAGDGHE